MRSGWERFGCAEDRFFEIVEEAAEILLQLKAKAPDKAQVQADVGFSISNIHNSGAAPSPDFPKLRDQLRAAVRSLAKANRAIEKINQVSVFKSLQENHIRPALDATSFYAERMAFRSGGPRMRDGKSLNTGAKRAAAAEAHALILRWTDRKPTQSAEGPYFQLARLLFEAATGIPAEEGPARQGIQRQCRDYARWWKAQAKG
jgi:hypothetical protein